MSINKNKLDFNRNNTYSENEYFKVAVISNSQNISLKLCKYFTGTKETVLLREDLLRSKYKDTHLICYPISEDNLDNNTTKVFEGIIFYVEEYDFLLNIIKPAISKYFENIKPRILLSNNKNAINWSNEINAKFIKDFNLSILTNTKNNSQKYIIDLLNSLDTNEFIRIKDKFEEFDIDNSGSITKNELKLIASQFEESIKNNEFENSILAFDKNKDGCISLDEFISWWKLGRSDPLSFTKLFDLQEYISKMINEYFDLNKLEALMEESLKNNYINNKKLSDVKINLNSNSNNNLDINNKTRIYIKASIGEEERSAACKNYLSRYNNKMIYNFDYFVDIAIFITTNTIDNIKLIKYINEFKDNLIELIDKEYIPGFKSLLKNFILVKTYSSEYSVNLHIEFKYDIVDLLKKSLEDYLKITSWLTNKGRQNTSFSLSYLSDKYLNEILDQTGVLKDFFNNCDIEMKFKYVKDYIKNLTLCYKGNDDKNTNSLLSFMQPLFISNKIYLNYKGNLLELISLKNKNLLDLKMDFIKNILNWIKNNISEELRNYMSRLEFAVNIADSFYSIQLFAKDIWK